MSQERDGGIIDVVFCMRQSRNGFVAPALRPAVGPLDDKVEHGFHVLVGALSGSTSSFLFLRFGGLCASSH